MKISLYLFIALLLSLSSVAQTPGTFNYQAVIRDSSGGILANKEVTIKLELVQGNLTKTMVYTEDWKVETNLLGMVNLEIGSKYPDTFSKIDWSNGPFTVDVSVDGQFLGTSPLLSVPFAMQAQSVVNDKVDDADADPTNEIQDISITGNKLSITNGSTITLPEASAVEAQTLSISGQDLSISGGNSVVIPSTPTQTLSISGQQISISGGNSIIIPDRYQDADADPTNEIELPPQLAGDANKYLAASGSGGVSWQTVNGITSAQATAITDNTSAISTEITRATTAEGANATAISDEATTARAAELLNASDISDIQTEQTTQNTAIALNTAKVGITAQQASDITANNAKVGITTVQASEIAANTAKNSYPSADATKLAGIAIGANVGVVPNADITPATKTKITYDAKGLVTSGTDATTADIATSTDKNYVTDAQLTVLGSVQSQLDSKADLILSNLSNTATAQTNLGLGTIAVQDASSVAITGGAINSTSIGATTPGTGSFTTLNTTGSVGIGTTSPNASAALDIVSTTGALLLPRLTSAEQDALTVENGMVVFNSTEDAFQLAKGGTGTTTITQNSYSGNAGMKASWTRGQTFQSVGNGQLTLTFQIQTASVAGNIQFRLYTDNTKSTLLATSNSVAVSSGGDYTFTFTGYDLVNTTTYYFESYITDGGLFLIPINTLDPYPNGESNIGAGTDLVFNISIGASASWNSIVTADDISGIMTNASDISILQSEQATQNTAIALNTAKTGITTAQATAITDNTSAISTEITRATTAEGINATAISDEVTRATTAEGSLATSISEEATTARAAELLNASDISDIQTEQITQNTAIALNTAKVGITVQQASDITANNAKVGITTAQASEIAANTAKNSYPSADATKLGGATNANTANTIVTRDASGDFAAGTITANLTGNASTATSATNVSGTVAITNGGTGSTTKAAAFDALSPMTATGDLIYGGAAGTGTILTKGTANQVLTMNSGATAPEWKTAANASIDGLSDARTTSSSVFLGYRSGQSDNSVADNNNTAVGIDALRVNSTGKNNTAFGFAALNVNTNGDYNTAVGSKSLQANTGGYNTAIGASSLLVNTTGTHNAALGALALYKATTASGNVALGANAMYNNITGAGNIAIGNSAGYNETGSNKLYIENSNSTTPLIYGEFDNDLVRINGKLEVTGTVKIEGGTPGAGKILTSDATGLARWETVALPTNNLITKTTNYTINSTDKYVICTTGGITITLPTAVGANGKEYIIKNISAANVTVAATGSEKIIQDSANQTTSAVLGVDAQNNWVKVVSDGADWISFRALY